MYQYSRQTAGFYTPEIHGEAIPADAVEITDAEHAALLEGQAAGGVIMADADGRPFLQAPPDPTLADLKAALVRSVDDGISGIYAAFTRFAMEYEAREAAALAFKAAGYEGYPGVWVQSFADAAGLPANTATDMILIQAVALRNLLSTLAALRMRKYEIKAAGDIAAAQAVHDQILAEAQAAAEGLS